MTKKEQTELGKYIALILRHKPEIIDIQLDKHGWANVSELIAGINKKQDFDMERLEQIVREDTKSRYSFNEDKTLIRANQGHSVKVDVELKEAIPPNVLYHGTATKYVDSIQKEGLRPQGRLHVHLSNDLETATNVGNRHGQLRIFEVNTKQMYEDGYRFYLSVNGVWLTSEVPIKYLTLMQLK